MWQNPPMPENQGHLPDALVQAKKAEDSEDFFEAAHFYKNALALARKFNDPDNIKFCTNKVVEMNKKLVLSGKDLKEISFVQPIPTNRMEEHEAFIQKFLTQGDLNTVLNAIGTHSYFFPKVSNVQKIANQRMPITYQIASLSTINDEGHVLRGSSDGAYAWFTEMYTINQRTIMDLYVSRIIQELIANESNNNRLNLQELSKYFSESRLFDPDNLKIINIGLERYFSGDHVSAMHILVPQFEAVFLKLSEKLGIDIVALERDQALSTRTKVLSESSLDSEAFKKVWGEDLCRQVKFILFEPMGFKLRHKIAHGEIDPEECNFQNSTLVLYLYLVLIARVKVKDTV